MVDQEIMKNKTILITGGTGSLGQELTIHILKQSPKSIRVFSRGEALQLEMQQRLDNKIVRFLIGDVRDINRLKRAMTNADIVIHVAALKQVPTCEYNPIEAVRTNIDGSVNIVDAALDCGVGKVLAISSDKAIHPVNLYGATKLVMEKLVVQANVYGDTKFSCVRFGNFWGSRGSVIPLWEEQRRTGTITLTDGDMVRFWINLEEAAEFTLSCVERMEGGEIFIPRMPSLTMKEIANAVAPEAKFEIIGKRPGEKLHELLFAEGEEERSIKEDDCWIIKA